MPYSLVGSSTLGFDLTRSPGGERVAVVLRAALAADSADLDRLDQAHPGDDARAARLRERTVHEDDPWRVETALGAAGVALDHAAQGDTRLLRKLEQSRIGDAAAIDRLVRRDYLDWTWIIGHGLATQDPVASRAADVLSDAAVAAFLEPTIPAPLRRALTAPFLQAGLALPDEPAGTGHDEVDTFLGLVAEMDDDVRRAWRTTVERHRARTAEWAPAMHAATWALSASDRLRAGADAQLAASIAFRRAGFTLQDAAYGVWNALSGVVQAMLVDDLLPGSTADVLLRPWREVRVGG